METQWPGINLQTVQNLVIADAARHDGEWVSVQAPPGSGGAWHDCSSVEAVYAFIEDMAHRRLVLVTRTPDGLWYGVPATGAHSSG